MKRGKESGVDDDVGVLVEVLVLVRLVEVGFAEPDKHGRVAAESCFELGSAESVFESGATAGETIGFRGKEMLVAICEGSDFGF